ncbi:hypothetical protein [Roseovarius sp. Pro17]|uniref:hypothetical protein n=1 Tax=Roseovarius sp. Pro17 TaxID=3108175 RepID=UPI002D799EC6|nr:hypothetical protein [Roseovarius sp. Pro17]
MAIFGSLMFMLLPLATLSFFRKEHNMADRKGACPLLNHQTSQVYRPEGNEMRSVTMSALPRLR